MKAPVRVAVTGAAGQIGYSLLFRIANGDMLGPEQPVILQLLETPNEKVQKALRGVMMEIDDCAFPLLAGMIATDDPKTAFRDCDIALLVGAKPRGPGMERKDLLAENAKIFIEQGKITQRKLQEQDLSAHELGDQLDLLISLNDQAREISDLKRQQQQQRREVPPPSPSQTEQSK